MAAKTEPNRPNRKPKITRPRRSGTAISSSPFRPSPRSTATVPSCGLGDEKSKLQVEVIPTGSIAIDTALGAGGLPRGRIIEIFGPESSGKTTLTLTVIAQAQRMGGVAAFIDVEHALDPSYARKLGVNMNELLVSQPDSGERR